MKKIILILIIFLGFILRTLNLDVSPPGFNADEAALGYNAYSLIKTGKDEWGESFPLNFKSFSDYKPGLYVYLVMPFVAVLGLSEFAVRMPSILLGTFTILLIYLLSKNIFKSEIAGLSTAFLLAVSPWHLHYSRGAWETNVATFFITLGILGFIKGLEKGIWFVVSVLGFVLAMYAYQSPRLLVPILVILFFLAYFKKLSLEILKPKKEMILAIGLGVLLIIPLIFVTFGDKGLARFQGVSIFTDIGPNIKTNQDRGEHQGSEIVAKTYHNKYMGYGLNFFEHYFDHFTPNFLFVAGDPLGRNKVPEMGQLYLFEMLTLVMGIYFVLSGKFSNSKIIFIWLFVAPIAASITYQTPHALRANNMVVPLTLISGLGLGMILEKIWNLKSFSKFGILGLFVGLIIFFVVHYLHQYYVHLPKQYALEWEYGFSKMVPTILEKKDKYEKVVITTRYDQPYILMLFYSQFDPEEFRNTAKSSGIDKFGFSTINSYDKYEFKEITKDEVYKSKNTLFVGTDEEIPADIKPLNTINFPNGKPVFKIVGT